MESQNVLLCFVTLLSTVYVSDKRSKTCQGAYMMPQTVKEDAK